MESKQKNKVLLRNYIYLSFFVCLPILICLILILTDFGVKLSLMVSMPLYLFIIPYSFKKFKDLSRLKRNGIVVNANFKEISGVFKGIYRLSVEIENDGSKYSCQINTNTSPEDYSTYDLLIELDNLKNYLILRENHKKF